jgi:tetratricopeptide (TPR) repeat protein
MHRSDDAFRELNASIDEFKAQRNWEWLATALNQRGLFLAGLGRIAEAEADFHEAVDISIRSRSSAPQIQALIYTAYILPSNEWNAANIAAEALSVAKREHRTDVASRAQLTVGEYFLRKDDLERASKSFDLIRFSQPSLTRVLMRAALHLAEIALKRKDREAAQRSIITAGSLDGSPYQDLPELNSLLRSLDRGDFEQASKWINQRLKTSAFEDSGVVPE